jgi:hypothetical protein
MSKKKLWFFATKYLHLFPYSKIVCVRMKSFSHNSHLWLVPKLHQYDSKLNENSKFKPIMFIDQSLS